MTTDRKRGRPHERRFAALAGDAIRRREYADVTAAALVYFANHIEQREERRGSESAIRLKEYHPDRFRDFTRYIVEDLRNGPKSIHVYKVLSQRYKKQSEQPKIRKIRHDKLMAIFRSVLTGEGQ